MVNILKLISFKNIMLQIIFNNRYFAWCQLEKYIVKYIDIIKLNINLNKLLEF